MKSDWVVRPTESANELERFITEHTGTQDQLSAGAHSIGRMGQSKQCQPRQDLSTHLVSRKCFSETSQEVLTRAMPFWGDAFKLHSSLWPQTQSSLGAHRQSLPNFHLNPVRNWRCFMTGHTEEEVSCSRCEQWGQASWCPSVCWRCVFWFQSKQQNSVYSVIPHKWTPNVAGKLEWKEHTFSTDFSEHCHIQTACLYVVCACAKSCLELVLTFFWLCSALSFFYHSIHFYFSMLKEIYDQK